MNRTGTRKPSRSSVGVAPATRAGFLPETAGSAFARRGAGLPVTIAPAASHSSFALVFRRRFGDHPHDRLGVAAADVEPPVGPVEPQAVLAVDAGIGPAAFRVPRTQPASLLARHRRTWSSASRSAGNSATSCENGFPLLGHERQDERHADERVAHPADARVDHAAVALRRR